MLKSLLVRSFFVLLLVGSSGKAAILRPGELVQVADGQYRDPQLIGRLGVRDYAFNNQFGHLILLTNGTLVTPSSSPPVGEGVVALAAGPQFVWLIQDSGRALRWGVPGYPEQVWSNIAQIDVKDTNSLGVTRDGVLVGEGVPDGIRNVKKAIWGPAAYNSQVCGLAVLSNGMLTAWGSPQTAIPPGMTDIVDVASGDGHVLALHSNGRISGWGRNDYGQVTPPVVTNAVAVVASDFTSFALQDNGQFFVWGFSGSAYSGGWGDRATNLGRFLSLGGVGKIRGNILIGDYPRRAPPAIVTFDNQQYRRTGARIKLAAEVSGSPPLFFQWSKDGRALAGETNQFLAISRALVSDSGDYTLTVSNSLGVAESARKRVEISSDQEPAIDVWVTTGGPSGSGSLPDAMARVPAGGVIGIDCLGDVFCRSEFRISTPLRILGVSPGYTRIRNAIATNRFFSVLAEGSLTLENLGLAVGRALSGGAISNLGRTTISGCIFRDNQTTGADGGAIFSSGQLRVDHTLFELNMAYAAVTGWFLDSPPVSGGAIKAAGGLVAISACEFVRNAAYADDSRKSEAYSGLGGALAFNSSIVQIDSSTFLENSARGGAGGPGQNYGPFYLPPGIGGAALGGGLFSTNSLLFITNATFVGNQTIAPGRRSEGAAMFAGGASTSGVFFATIVSNSCSGPANVLTNGAAIRAEPTANVFITASILSRNLSGDGVSHAVNVASAGYNLVDRSNDWPKASTDLIGDPQLFPLADNNGPTRTLAPAWSSPAVDAGVPHPLIAVDQRGLPRPSGLFSDIGAVELQQGPPIIASQSQGTAVPIGSEITPSAVAIGPLPLSLQWLFENTGIPGATNANFTIASFRASDEGNYFLVASNRYGSVKSAPIYLRALAGPGFVASLTNQIAATGQTVVFQIAASGLGPFEYSWYYNDQLIPGAVGSSLLVTNVERAQAGVYRVRVNNVLGVAESAAELRFWPLLEVSSLADRGPGSLREAMQIASATPAAFLREIVFRTNGVVHLESSLPVIATALDVAGIDAFHTIIDGQQSNSVFLVTNSGSLSLETMTIRGGLAKRNDSGGGIRNDGLLKLGGCMVVSNRTQGGFGGGIANKGALVVNACSFLGNLALGQPSGLGGAGAGFGGAIFNEGTLLVTNATFSGNSAIGGSAGASDISSSGPSGGGPEGGMPGQSGYSGTMTRPGAPPGSGGFGGGGGQGAGFAYGDVSYFPDPGAAGGFGGGGGAGGSGFVSSAMTEQIAAPGGRGGYGGGGGVTCIFTNTTPFPTHSVSVTAGGGAGMGGAIFVKTGAVAIVNCTISDNSAEGGSGSVGWEHPDCIGGSGSGFAGGVFNYQGTVAVRNSIVAQNVGQTLNSDLEGAVVSNGHNLIQHFAPDSGVLPGDALTGDLRLKPLADNGGGTLTYALNPGSPALGGGAFETAVDQRGVVRSPVSDIGAYQTETARVQGVTVEGANLVVYLHVPAGQVARLQQALSINGPWRDGLPVPAGERVQVKIPMGARAEFIRVFSE